MFKNSTFHIVRFLLVFFILTTFFYTYVGIVSSGGKYYSPFLERYANFPAWVTYFICKSAVNLLHLIGYDAYQKALNNVSIRGSRGINIIWACLGFGVMSFWVAFVTAHRAVWKYKLKWVAIGVILITGINIIRMDLIALGFHYDWKAFNAIDLHFAFNIVSYIAIFVLLIWFIKKYRNYQSTEKYRNQLYNKKIVTF